MAMSSLGFDFRVRNNSYERKRTKVSGYRNSKTLHPPYQPGHEEKSPEALRNSSSQNSMNRYDPRRH